MSLFSIVIPWKGRPELRQTLEANAELFTRHTAEVAVVNCGGDADALGAILDCPRDFTVRHLFLPDAEFNRSLAKNIGVALTTRPYVFLLDADIVLTSDIFAEALAQFASASSLIMLRRLHETEPPPPTTKELLEDVVVSAEGRLAHLRFLRWDDGSRSNPGQMLVERAHFLEVDGFNSALTGWGFEDLDFQLRVQLVTGVPLVTAGEGRHLSHSDGTRGVVGASREADHERNMRACIENYQHGHFHGTYTEDNRVWGPRTIETGRAAHHAV